jgi:large subunit ribosomal protein L25
MAELIKAEKRTERGTRQARRMRKQGFVPGVVYGHQQETLSITISHEELFRAIRHGARVVDLQADGETEKALIKDVQWDPLGHDILHVDFTRVSEHERIVVDVRIELRGTAPGIAAGGVLDQTMHTIEIECPALSVPDSIRVAVGALQLNEAIHVKDLTFPPGVVAKADPDAVVVQVNPKVVEEEAAPAPAVEATAEPEVIGRVAKPEEEETE